MNLSIGKQCKWNEVTFLWTGETKRNIELRGSRTDTCVITKRYVSFVLQHRYFGWWCQMMSLFRNVATILAVLFGFLKEVAQLRSIACFWTLLSSVVQSSTRMNQMNKTIDWIESVNQTWFVLKTRWKKKLVNSCNFQSKMIIHYQENHQIRLLYSYSWLKLGLENVFKFKCKMNSL